MKRVQETGTSPTKYDHPVTMAFYLDNDRLLLKRIICDAGNRPRMAARTSADGKTVEFRTLCRRCLQRRKYGHMEHAVFTIIDDNHHTEDWTYLMPGDKPMHAHFNGSAAGKVTPQESIHVWRRRDSWVTHDFRGYLV